MITDFEITGYDNNANVGVAWNCHFTLVFFNNGTVDIEDAIVMFKTNSTYNIDRTIAETINSSGGSREGLGLRMGELCSLGSVKVGEEKYFYGTIENDLADNAKIRGCAFTATLKSNDMLLDQATIIIP